MIGVRELYRSSNSIVVCYLWLGSTQPQMTNPKRYILRSKDPRRLACRVNLNVISHSMKWIRMWWDLDLSVVAAAFREGWGVLASWGSPASVQVSGYLLIHHSHLELQVLFAHFFISFFVQSRVFLKRQTQYLWPGDLNLLVSIDEDLKSQKSYFYLKNWPRAPWGFSFWHSQDQPG